MVSDPPRPGRADHVPDSPVVQQALMSDLTRLDGLIKRIDVAITTRRPMAASAPKNCRRAPGTVGSDDHTVHVRPRPASNKLSSTPPADGCTTMDRPRRSDVARRPLEQRREAPVLTDRGAGDGKAVDMGAPVSAGPLSVTSGALSRETFDIRHISLGSTGREERESVMQSGPTTCLQRSRSPARETQARDWVDTLQ